MAVSRQRCEGGLFVQSSTGKKKQQGRGILLVAMGGAHNNSKSFGFSSSMLIDALKSR